MTREQYERSRQQLEEQLRTGIALLESAYHAQVRALDLVWMLHSQEGAPSRERVEPAAPAQRELPPQSRRRSAPEVRDDVASSLWQLPEVFTRGDVCVALGYEPDRGALYRALRELERAGYLSVEEAGAGQRATLYRKTVAPDSPESG